MKSKEAEEYYNLMRCLSAMQFLMESFDLVKHSKLYRHELKNLINRLEAELLKRLGSDYKKIYMRDEESFNILLQSLEQINNTLVKEFTLNEVVDLSEKLKFMAVSFNITKEEFAELKENYQTALKKNYKTMVLQGKEITRDYAGNLIKYISKQI